MDLPMHEYAGALNFERLGKRVPNAERSGANIENDSSIHSSVMYSRGGKASWL